MEGPGPSSSQASISSKHLFTGSSPNEPLHFHIHTAIPSKLKAEIVNLIETHGGKVHKRLINLHCPFYALVYPGAPKLAEYATYVTTREPSTERGTVVPYSFVRASIAARRVLTPAEFQPRSESDSEEVTHLASRAWAPLALTRQAHGLVSGEQGPNHSTGNQEQSDDDGWGGLEPVTVHLHATLTQRERTSLAVTIAKAGGDPTSSITTARVILANEDHAQFSELKKRYEHSLNTYVEPASWVKRCVAKGHYFHDPLPKAPMGGRKPGADRNDFTTEDDTRLAQFIAKRIPNKIDGGRTGNNLYKDLCDRTDIYPWAASHTWQSWRNRYRKRQEYFDPIVDNYATKRQHNGDGKGEYAYSRGKKRITREDSPVEASDQENERGTRPRPSKEANIEKRRNQHETSPNPRRRRPNPKESSSASTSQLRTRRKDDKPKRHALKSGDSTADVTSSEQADHQAERTRPAAAMGAMDSPTLDPDPSSSNMDELDTPSTYYGYGELDRDVHDKARDLGLRQVCSDGDGRG